MFMLLRQFRVSTLSFMCVLILAGIARADSYPASNRPVAGIIAVSQGTAQAVYHNGTAQQRRAIQSGDTVYLNDEIITDADVKTQILLKDQSVFTIGAQGRISFDTFTYNTTQKTGKLAVKIHAGVFRFTSGKIAKANPDNMKVTAGQAEIAVRGTEVAGRVGENGSSFILLSGAINVTTAQGGKSIIKPGWGIGVSQNGQITAPRPVPENELTEILVALEKEEPQKGKSFDDVVLKTLTSRATSTKTQEKKVPAFSPSESPRRQTEKQRREQTPTKSDDKTTLALRFIQEKRPQKSRQPIVKEEPKKDNKKDEGRILLTNVPINNKEAVKNKDNGKNITKQITESITKPVTRQIVKQPTRPKPNEAPFRVSINNNLIPDRVFYATRTQTTDNLLINPDFSDDGNGWSFENVGCSKKSCGQLHTNKRGETKLATGSDLTAAWQNIQLAEQLGLNSIDTQRGGVLNWFTDVRQNSNFCKGGGSSPACDDTARVRVTAENWLGLEILNQDDIRTQKANWNLWQQSRRMDTIPEEVTYYIEGRDAGEWSYTSFYGPQFRNPFLSFTYEVSQDVVVGTLFAHDSHDSEAFTYVLAQDNSGLFEIRGNQLILKGGTALAAEKINAYNLLIDVTDDRGATASLPLTISVQDARNVETKITQNLKALEDSPFTFEVDFGTTQSVEITTLPSWLTLQDLANGRVLLSGTAPESGEVSFSVTATKDGETTTAYYQLGVDDSCTGAYCTEFASSPDTVNRSAYLYKNGRHTIDGENYYNFDSWDNIHTELQAGTASYEGLNIPLETLAGGGDWLGNIRVSVDYGQRKLHSTVWGQFANHNNLNGTNLSGSFLTEGATRFGAHSLSCSAPGVCTIDSDFTTLRTCTELGGTCAQNNHPQAQVTGIGTFQLLRNGMTYRTKNYTALGRFAIRDAFAASPNVATSNPIVLDPQ